MALALLLRGGRGAPLSTGFGTWLRYGWMALRLSTLPICRRQKSQCRNNAPEGHKRHLLICRMNHKVRRVDAAGALQKKFGFVPEQSAAAGKALPKRNGKA